MRDPVALLPRTSGRYAHGVGHLWLGGYVMPEGAFQQLLLSALEGLKTDVAQIRTQLGTEGSEIRAAIERQGSAIRAEYRAADAKLEADVMADLARIRTDLGSDITRVDARLGERVGTVEKAQATTDQKFAEQKGRNAAWALLVSLIASPIVSATIAYLTRK